MREIDCGKIATDMSIQFQTEGSRPTCKVKDQASIRASISEAQHRPRETEEASYRQ